MNIKKYYLDNNSNEIFITVTVSTPGIARSEAEITLLNGVTNEIAHSNDGTGLISRVSIGKASDLIGTLVEVDTDIILDKVPSADWPNCYENLVIKYYLEGGSANQEQPFLCEPQDKHKSVSGKTIGAEKYVSLVKK